jgi:hypothetical protein
LKSSPPVEVHPNSPKLYRPRAEKQAPAISRQLPAISQNPNAPNTQHP